VLFGLSMACPSSRNTSEFSRVVVEGLSECRLVLHLHFPLESVLLGFLVMPIEVTYTCRCTAMSIWPFFATSQVAKIHKAASCAVSVMNMNLGTAVPRTGEMARQPWQSCACMLQVQVTCKRCRLVWQCWWKLALEQPNLPAPGSAHIA